MDQMISRIFFDFFLPFSLSLIFLASFPLFFLQASPPFLFYFLPPHIYHGYIRCPMRVASAVLYLIYQTLKPLSHACSPHVVFPVFRTFASKGIKPTQVIFPLCPPSLDLNGSFLHRNPAHTQASILASFYSSLE